MSSSIAKLAGIGTLAAGLACSGVPRPPPEPAPPAPSVPPSTTAPAAVAPSLEAWFEEGLATYEAHYDQWVTPLPEGGEFDGTLAVPPAERDWLRRWVGEQVDAGPFSPELKAELRARAAKHEASGPCGLGCALTDSDDGTHATDLELVAGPPTYALLSTSLPGLDYLVVRLELRDGQVVRAERVTDVDAYALLDGEPADGAGH